MRIRLAFLLCLAFTPLAPLPASATTVTARHLLTKLPVHVEQNAGYDRSKFTHWIDADGDGCDTRAEVLIAESQVRVIKNSSCTVISGRWLSVFDGQIWQRASDVDIDHLVALGEAWGSGAKGWSAIQRTRYANDLTYHWSLNAMTDNLNASKSDSDPSEWLPPTERCRYVTRWMAVKYRWRLSVDQGEKAAISQFLTGFCGHVLVRLPRRAPADPGSGGGGGGGGNCSDAYPSVCIPPPPPDLDCGDISFRNFKVLAPDPHNFDGDGDGVGCEV